MHNFFEKATRIQQDIAIYCRRQHDTDAYLSRQDPFDKGWGASYLYAAILEKAEISSGAAFSREQFTVMYDNFQEQTGRTCNVDQLFAQNWLRIVNGEIHISRIVRVGIERANKVRELDKEFDFLRDLFTIHEDKKIPAAVFRKAVELYQRKHSVTLDIVTIVDIRWLSRNEDHAIIMNFRQDEIYLLHANEFLFLQHLTGIIKELREHPLIISKQILEDLLLAHRRYFAGTPTIEQFKEAEALVNINATHYALRLRYCKMPFVGRVHHQGGAILWERLLNDPTMQDDRQRLSYWYDRVVRFSDWCSIGDLISPSSLSRFIAAAVQLLLHEPDLTNGRDEFARIILDTGDRYDNFSQLCTIIDKTDLPDHTDLFWLYNDLTLFDNRWQGELMHHQSSRSFMKFLVHQVVRQDQSRNFEQVFTLLEAGPEKPFLLWTAAFTVFYWRTDIIPFLLKRPSTASLAFSLLLKAKRTDGIFAGKTSIFIPIVTRCFELLCEWLVQQPDLASEEKAKIIFQWFLLAENECTKIIGPSEKRRQMHKADGEALRAGLQKVFENAKLPGTYYSDGHASRQSWFPELIDGLLECVTGYQPKDYFGYNSINLPFARLNLFAWLLSLNNEQKNQDTEKEKHSLAISQQFLATYLEVINRENERRAEVNPALPVWSYQQPNIEQADWRYIFLSLERYRLLDGLIRPVGLVFRNTANKYDGFNGFIANKIRTHLSVLLTGYDRLFSERSILRAKGWPVESVLAKLESAITVVVTQYCLDDSVNGRVDIFSHLLERTFWHADREELLPMVAASLNRFKPINKKEVIQELVKQEPVVRALKLMEYLSSENDKEELITLISTQDIQDFFSSSTISDKEFVLQKLAETGHFKEKAREALEIWERIPLKQLYGDGTEHAILCFRMKLLLAYHELDKQAIIKTTEPVLKSSSANHSFSAEDEKKFYIALIYFQQKQAEKAFQHFNKLFSSMGNDRPAIAINCFAAKLLWADQTSNLLQKNKLYQEALEEWSRFEEALLEQTDIDYLKEHIWYNKMHAYNGLKKYADFDIACEQLERSIQLRPDFLKLQMQSLVERHMHLQAERLLSEAEEFHRLGNGEVPENITKLRSLTDSPDTEHQLQAVYLRILSKPAPQLIRILPKSKNEAERLGEFLAIEMIGAATDMLTCINSIAEITKEDKYSDLLILSLTARFRHLNWHIGPARAGGSASGQPNPGLIDFAIWSGKEKLAIGEPFLLSTIDRKVIKSHLYKIFNYDPARKLFYSIIYFKGPSLNFSRCWESYKEIVTKEAEFPTGFALVSDSLQDMSEEFGSSSVFVAKSMHDTTTELYHIFINLGYLLPPATESKKITRSKKSAKKE